MTETVPRGACASWWHQQAAKGSVTTREAAAHLAAGIRDASPDTEHGGAARGRRRWHPRRRPRGWFHAPGPHRRGRRESVAAAWARRGDEAVVEMARRLAWPPCPP
ncbi:hypothetical protein QJS66_10825 [Kocuria rhizophila]|nr:hypothetical protein QJS66_10825 [Kocuria rhizophila]